MRQKERQSQKVEPTPGCWHGNKPGRFHKGLVFQDTLCEKCVPKKRMDFSPLMAYRQTVFVRKHLQPEFFLKIISDLMTFHETRGLDLQAGWVPRATVVGDTTGSEIWVALASGLRTLQQLPPQVVTSASTPPRLPLI